MFIEVKCSDGIRRLVSLMRIDTIEPDLGSSRIWVGETSYIASEPYEALIERISECCPGISGHFRAP